MLATHNFLLPKEDDYEHIKQVLVIQLPFPTSFCSEKTENFQSYRKKTMHQISNINQWVKNLK